MLSEFMSSNDIETNDPKHGEDVNCESFAEDILVEDKILHTPQSLNEIQNYCEEDVRNMLPCDQEKELVSFVFSFQDFIEQLIEAPLDHSSYEKESFSIDVEDHSIVVSLDSRTNTFEEWGNDTCMRSVKLHILDKKLKLFDASNNAQINACIGGLKRCILDKKLKLFVKSEKSANLQRLFGWDPGIF
ncbi:hypothetical protein GQ457_12G014870 [Hibiscus cannabinus]